MTELNGKYKKLRHETQYNEFMAKKQLREEKNLINNIKSFSKG
jgi:hypothetical protein